MSLPVRVIAEFMTPSPHSIERDQPLAAAHRVMREHRIRHLPVLDGGKLVGIVSDRGLHLAETLPDVDSERVPVEDAMTPSPYTIAPSTPVATVARQMADHKLGSAVVVEGSEIVGVFTATDALRALAQYAEGEVAAGRAVMASEGGAAASAPACHARRPPGGARRGTR